MFDVGLIVLRKLLFISGEKEGRIVGWGKKTSGRR